jgi:hypothetical protein
MPRWLLSAVFTVLVVALATAARPAAATQIWSGRTFAFSRAANANPTLAANQDRITPLVWITRGGTQGIYNIKSEAAYGAYYSPAGTEWATGDAVNYGSLSFSDWQTWSSANPPSTLGVNACLHLIAEDIYLDIRFDSWGVGTGGGGAFSYHRAVQPATGTLGSTWGRIKSLYR